MSQLLAIRPRSGPGPSNPHSFDHLRQRLPRDLSHGLRLRAAALARAAIATVAREVPEYADTVGGPLGPIVVATAQTVIQTGIDAVLDPRAPQQDWTELCDSVGAAEFAAGRSLDVLQHASRVAEQVLAQQVAVHVRRYGASVDLARMCAAAVAAHFRALAARAVHGYRAAQLDRPRPADRSREDVLRLILAEFPVDPATLAAAARAARWPLPATVVAITLRPSAAAEPPSMPDFGPGVLTGMHGGEPCLLIAGDAAVPELPPGWRAAAGPPGPLTAAAASLRVARRALDLADRGLLPIEPMLQCVQHQVTLMLFADDWVIQQLVELRLAPLRGLTERQRDRLLVTLHEWLVTRGQANEIAERLGVHPQTVRYRMKRLEELFGDQLTAPQHRFELTLAARAQLLLRGSDGTEVAQAC